MPPKDDRIVADHIFIVLKNNKEGLRFRNIKIEMIKKEWIHSDTSIIQNCHWLEKQNKVIKIGPIYRIKS